jgi:hypothetical protein
VTKPAPERDGAGAGAVALTLAPVTLDAFRRERFDSEPLLVARGEEGRFDALLSTADAERIVCTTGLRTPGFRLVRDGVPLPPSAYADDIPWRPGAFTGTVAPGRVAAAFAEGATIVLQALQVHWHPAARYCRGLEAALGFPVQANAYWTPASAQGFTVHHDTHDVFILQVSGTKRWRVYAPILELPLKDQKWSPGLGNPGAPVIDAVLAPGDTLYLPRGWPHEAETSDAASLHVTVGLHPPTRLDALRAALDAAAAEDVELRRALDPDGALPAGLIERLEARLAPAAVAARAREAFVRSRRPVLDGHIGDVGASGALRADTPVRRRDTVIADLDGAVLSFEGREIEFPPHARTALAAVHATSAPFTAADLPGPLDEAGRLVLLRRLIREGYLRAA